MWRAPLRRRTRARTVDLGPGVWGRGAGGEELDRNGSGGRAAYGGAVPGDWVERHQRREARAARVRLLIGRGQGNLSTPRLPPDLRSCVSASLRGRPALSPRCPPSPRRGRGGALKRPVASGLLARQGAGGGAAAGRALSVLAVTCGIMWAGVRDTGGSGKGDVRPRRFGQDHSVPFGV